MTTQPNLRELLDGAGFAEDGSGDVYASVEAWAFGGQVRECETCGGLGSVGDPACRHANHVGTACLIDCPTCHGTGEVRGPGLVERVGKAAWEAREMVPDGPDPRATAWVNALREELGTP